MYMYFPGAELMAKSILAIPAGICTFIISDRSTQSHIFSIWALVILDRGLLSYD